MSIRARPFSDSRESWRELVVKVVVRREDGFYHEIQLDQTDIRVLLKEFQNSATSKDRKEFAIKALSELDDPEFLQVMAQLLTKRSERLSKTPATTNGQTAIR